MAPAENKNKDTEGGDDLGTMDEIRVFKDEGEFEEEDAAESLHADLFEEEGNEGSKEGRGESKSDPSAFKNPLSVGYPGLPSNPYLPGGYPPHPLHPAQVIVTAQQQRHDHHPLPGEADLRPQSGGQVAGHGETLRVCGEVPQHCLGSVAEGVAVIRHHGVHNASSVEGSTVSLSRE